MALATGIEIHALVDRYGEAWNAHDLDLITSFHAEDGTHCLHTDRERAHGTDEIREAFASYPNEWPDILVVDKDTYCDVTMALRQAAS